MLQKQHKQTNCEFDINIDYDSYVSKYFVYVMASLRLKQNKNLNEKDLFYK